MKTGGNGAGKGRRALIVSGGQTDPGQLAAEYDRLKADGGILIAADSGLEVIRRLRQGINEEADTEIQSEAGMKPGTRMRLETGMMPGIEADSCTDGAGQRCLPDIVVGDFDSVSPATLGYFQQIRGIRWERHRAEKDESDTELAFTIAAEEGCRDILLMGATGTRVDHLISNIHLLKAGRDRGLACTMLDLHNRIRLTTESMTFSRADSPYPFISFIQLSEEVTHMTLTGFKYSLTDYHMVLGVECGHCVSNEIAAEEARLSFDKGILLVIESRD